MRLELKGLDTSMKITEFERIVVDVDIFRTLLESALHDWDGTYGVLVAETNEFLYKTNAPDNTEFSTFSNNQTDVSEQLGTIYFASPIKVHDRLIATLFVGKKSNSKSEDSENSFDGEIAIDNSGSKASHESIKRVIQLIDYIVEIGSERLQLIQEQKHRVRIEQEKSNQDDQRTRLANVLITDSEILTSLTNDLETFWSNVGQILEKMSVVIGASCAMVLQPTGKNFEKDKLRVVAVTGLQQAEFLHREYPFYDDIFKKVLEGNPPIVQASFDNLDNTNTISGSIKDYDEVMSGRLDYIQLTRVKLDKAPEELHGLILFVFDEDNAQNYLPSTEIGEALLQFATLVGTTHQNSSLYKRQEQWLERVTHQLIAPLNGLLGHASNQMKRFQNWQNDTTSHHLEGWTGREIERWTGTLRSMVDTATYATRLARNLAWTVYIDARIQNSINLQTVDDFSGLLTKSIQGFQGLAGERNLLPLYIDTDSISILNGKFELDVVLFRQAFENLLDNAVKYSKPNTRIIIKSYIQNKKGYILVINDGICLREEDIENVFKDEFRTTEARFTYAPGTGIGLSVARQSINLHKGTLTVRPSTLVGKNVWRTEFEICLPLSN